jgi:hypothetical protein
MTEKNADMARLLMAAEAGVEELDRQGLLEALIHLGLDPDQVAMAVIKSADGGVVPLKRAGDQVIRKKNRLYRSLGVQEQTAVASFDVKKARG